MSVNFQLTGRKPNRRHYHPRPGNVLDSAADGDRHQDPQPVPPSHAAGRARPQPLRRRRPACSRGLTVQELKDRGDDYALAGQYEPALALWLQALALSQQAEDGAGDDDGSCNEDSTPRSAAASSALHITEDSDEEMGGIGGPLSSPGGGQLRMPSPSSRATTGEARGVAKPARKEAAADSETPLDDDSHPQTPALSPWSPQPPSPSPQAVGRGGASAVPSLRARLHEQCAQAYLELDQVWHAVRAAESAVACAPGWATAHRSLGRARLAFGDLAGGVASLGRCQEVLDAGAEPAEAEEVACELREAQLSLRRRDDLWTEEFIQEQAELIRSARQLAHQRSSASESEMARLFRLNEELATRHHQRSQQQQAPEPLSPDSRP